MLLYDIFYPGRSFDADVPLPAKAPYGARAVCTNGARIVYIAVDGKWVEGVNPSPDDKRPKK